MCVLKLTGLLIAPNSNSDINDRNEMRVCDIIQCVSCDRAIDTAKDDVTVKSLLISQLIFNCAHFHVYERVSSRCMPSKFFFGHINLETSFIRSRRKPKAVKIVNFNAIRIDQGKMPYTDPGHRLG